MLKQLYIKNFTLIDELDIPLYPGFSVITGETGAGKSIILGAIGLLLGNRADSKAIKAGRDRCVIEAHFDLSKYGMQDFFDANDIDYDAEDTIIRRELTAAGKSRAFINDTPVPLSKMRELGEQLVDIHSQHQNLLLQKEDFQLSVVDIIAHDEKQKKAYLAEYKNYKKAKQQLEDLKAEIAKNRENEEFMRFQFKELDDANLQEGELEQLEQEAGTLSHSEDIKTALYEADNALSGEDGSILDKLKNAALQQESLRHDSAVTMIRKELIRNDRERERKKYERTCERLNSLVITAPLKGQLSFVKVTPGQQVSSGESIAEIKVLDQYKIHTSLSEYYIDRITTGLPATVNYQGNKYPLKITKVVPEVKDRMFDVDLVFTGDMPDNVRVGKSFRVQIELGQPEQALIIPRGNFYQSTGGQWIYKVNTSKTKAVRVPLSIGRQNPQQYEIVEGLQSGDWVITTGYDTFGDAEELILK